MEGLLILNYLKGGNKKQEYLAETSVMSLMMIMVIFILKKQPYIGNELLTDCRHLFTYQKPDNKEILFET